MNKIKKLSIFSFSCFLFLNLIGEKNNTVKAETPSTKLSSSCSTPSSNSNYDDYPSIGSSSATYVTHYHGSIDVVDVAAHWTTATGWVSGHFDEKKVWVPGHYTNPSVWKEATYKKQQTEENSYSNSSCTGKYTTSGSKESGTIYLHATYSGHGAAATQTHYAYYVTSVTVKPSKTYHLDGETKPTFSCSYNYPVPKNTGCTSSSHYYKSGTPSQIEKWCSSYTKNGKTGEGCYDRHFPREVIITVSNEFSNVSQAAPTFNCTVYYYGVSDTRSCTTAMKSNKTVTNNEGSVVTCYSYKTSNDKSHSKCATRYLIKEMVITGSNKSYSGIKQNYLCNAVFYNNTTLSVTNLDDTWSASPHNHIGTNHPGFKQVLRDYTLTTSAKNEYYPTFNFDANNVIKCKYNTHKSNTYISDPTDKGKETTLTVKNHGVKELKIVADGKFYNPSSPGNFITKSNLVSPNVLDNSHVDADFLTGHWYNFRAYAMYSDGTNGNNAEGFREVTSVKETVWSQTGSYTDDNILSYNSKMYSNDGRMPAEGMKAQTSGIDNRIPVNGTNDIYVMFLETRTPGTVGPDNAIRDRLRIWSHEITSVEIKGTNYNTAPTLTVNPNTNYYYTAWVTFSDLGTNPFGRGQRENWTNAVTWKSDYLKSNGRIYTPRGKQKISLYAFFNDKTNLKGGNTVWDSHGDSKIITVVDDCKGITSPVDGCDIPDIWNVKDFKTKQNNYQPPASAYGYTSWNDENSFYKYIRPFKVTGVSTGVGQGQ